jgi:cytochrome bd-type quinol oxidase subunit 2
MLDRRRTRQLLIFFGNVVSGVVTPVGAFAVIASGDDNGPFAAALIFVVAPALTICGWTFSLGRQGRERDLAKRVARQAFWVLIAWEAVPIVFLGTVLALILTDIVTGRNDWSETVILILTFSAAAGLALWFTWVRSRRMADLLWPLPGMRERGSESPYMQLKL